MKKIFSGYRENQDQLWSRVEEWVTEQRSKYREDGGEYLNEKEVVIIEIHKEEK